MLELMLRHMIHVINFIWKGLLAWSYNYRTNTLPFSALD